MAEAEQSRGRNIMFKIREIQSKDNASVENIIRTCLTEFGGNREGTAWCDPDLGRFSEIYNKPGYKYWVAEKENGVAHELIKLCLDYATQYYEKCYLETFSNMIAAQKFYQKHGFQKLDKPYLDTGHYSCDMWYIEELNK